VLGMVVVSSGACDVKCMWCAKSEGGGSTGTVLNNFSWATNQPITRGCTLRLHPTPKTTNAAPENPDASRAPPPPRARAHVDMRPLLPST
jgi:hypothetical protein